MSQVREKEDVKFDGMDLYVPRPAKVVHMSQMTATEKFFRIYPEDGMPLGHSPGQFVQVSVAGVGEAPISICSAPDDKNTFELCVRTVGNVTNALHNLEKGDIVGIRGPFGKGFDPSKMMDRDILFIAGGIGLAPLRSLINYVVDLDHRSSFGKVTILYGVRTPKELLFKDELAQWKQRDDLDLKVTVDRGDESWTGHVGVVTTLFRDIDISPANTVVAIVGPPVMYRFVLLEVFNKKVPENQIYLSLERRMKCGVGKCGHCQINNIYVCQEGPVFSYPEVRELKEAIR